MFPSRQSAIWNQDTEIPPKPSLEKRLQHRMYGTFAEEWQTTGWLECKNVLFIDSYVYMYIYILKLHLNTSHNYLALFFLPLLNGKAETLAPFPATWGSPSRPWPSTKMASKYMANMAFNKMFKMPETSRCFFNPKNGQWPPVGHRPLHDYQSVTHSVKRRFQRKTGASLRHRLTNRVMSLIWCFWNVTN